MFRYVRLQKGRLLPDVSDLRPFKAIVVVEDLSARLWRDEASRWLVNSGCLYMMAWGDHCEAWDESVDQANLESFGFGAIPDDKFVVTTWHENEALSEVFEFAKVAASHPKVERDNILVLHIGTEDKHAKYQELFDKV